MRVLQINSTLNAGSTGRIAEGIGQKILEHGDESYIAYGRSSNPSQSQMIRIGNNWDQAVHLLKTRLFDTHGFHSRRATRALVQQIRKIQPDIIHLHNLHGYYINIEILFDFLKDWEKPIIWTLHDCWPFTGHCCYYERVKCIKWKSECQSCPLKWLYPQSYFYDNSLDNFYKKKMLTSLPKQLHLVTVSKWLESQVMQSFLQNRSLTTIYNGIDLAVFKPLNQLKLKKEYGFEGKQVILGVANIWTDGKGLRSFTELSKMINKNQVVILIGVTQKQLKHLPGNIVGIEQTSSVEELAKYYNLADVFVNPSIAETFGMTTAEAMACGTPSVVYETSAMPEMINDEVGFIVPFNNYQYLYEKINTILENGKEMYSEKCRARAEELFDLDKQYEKYTALYDSVLHSI
jgi:glycosyltransferase involved in cell wall biosynthesis